MSNMNGLSHLSEDDIRTKVVYQWLKNCGVCDAEILVEYSINLRLGRGIKTINSRTDVLIKNTEGRNLLIVEVKRPNHSLNITDKEQALSYARALADGGIAPFTILTNGNDTLIFDSVTGTEMVGGIQSDNQYVKNGFRVTGDALQAKAEALEYLISLSLENLLIFCKSQVESKMPLLKSNDLFSGKKYIPQLYVERRVAKAELEEKLFGNVPNQVTLVIGQPQQGKTCFLCHTIENYLEREIPVLFYPAVALKKGLLQEIQDDFEWAFGEQFHIPLLVSKLKRISERAGKKIILFIDGWNEMMNNALAINDECQRFQDSNIQVVVSTTSPSLTRLLQDEAGNLAYIAGETKLNAASLQRLTIKPLQNTKDISIVQIGPFEYDELQKGKELHEKAYNTKFANESNLPKDPFYLRLAAEIYANSAVPAFATRTELIRNGLIRKGARRGIQEIALFINLNELANVIIEKDAPFCCTDLPLGLYKDRAIDCWIESAILIHLFEKEIPEIDFYYTHDKDYCIAILNRRWHEKLSDEVESAIVNEFEKIIGTEAGRSALRWFLSCPEYCSLLEKIFPSFLVSGGIDDIKSKILTDSILNQVSFNNNLNFDWLEKYLTPILSAQVDQDKFADGLAGLIYSLLMSINREKEKAKYEFWMRLLVKYDSSPTELSVDESLICQYYGVDDIRTYFEDEGYTSLDISLFEKLILDQDLSIAINAAAILSFADPIFMLKNIPRFHRFYTQNRFSGFDQIIEESCNSIIAELHEGYYGSMCPGWLTDAEKGDEEAIEEFHKQKALWWPILRIIRPESKLRSNIIDMLKDLSEYLNEEGSKIEESSFPNPNQLMIDF